MMSKIAKKNPLASKTGQFATVGEVADVLRCDPHTVRRYIWEGKMRGFKAPYGNKWLIPVQDIQEHMKNMESIEERDQR